VDGWRIPRRLAFEGPSPRPVALVPNTFGGVERGPADLVSGMASMPTHDDVDPVTDRDHDGSWSANLEREQHADDPDLVVEHALDAIDHTARGTRVNPLLAALREREAHLPERCGGCDYVDVCRGGSRLRVLAATGGVRGDDLQCYHRRRGRPRGGRRRRERPGSRERRLTGSRRRNLAGAGKEPMP